MVTIKRYIGRFKKPPGWRGTRHFIRYVVLPAAVAVFLMLLVHEMWLTQVSVTTPQKALHLENGDRLLVNRSAYGLRLPFGLGGRQKRFFSSMPERGDLIAYHRHDGQLALGRVEALPGDTVDRPERGIVPEGAIVVEQALVDEAQIFGHVVCITYSVDPDRPFYKCLRGDRFFSRIE